MHSTALYLGVSVFFAPLVMLVFFLSLQASYPVIKGFSTQVIGLGVVLFNVIVLCLPLLWILERQTVAIVATVLWVLVAAYASYKANSVRTTYLSVSHSKLKSGYRLMHLSDIHAGSRSSGFVDKVVKQAMAEQPDIVLITGDLIDSSEVNAKYLASLSQFTCPVYLCLGNHERSVDLQGAIDAISANNITILRGESVVVHELQITGIDDADDPEKMMRKLQEVSLDETKFQVLLYHRPEKFEFAAKAGVNLMLSGHTHAGQIWPFGMLVKLRYPRIKGKYELNDAILYVSQGTGTWGPKMRLGSSNEMTLIECS